MQDNSFFLDVEGLYQKAYDLFSFGGPGAPSAFRSIWDNFYFWLQFASFGISIILFVVLVIILIRRKHIILEENKKPTEIPTTTIENFQLQLNSKTMKIQNVTIAPDLYFFIAFINPTTNNVATPTITIVAPEGRSK